MLVKTLEKFSCFETLTEPRRKLGGNFQHDLIDIIVIALCGTICHCETWEDLEDFAREREDWLKKYISLENGIPSHDTIARVISALDTTEFFSLTSGVWNLLAKASTLTAKRLVVAVIVRQA